jgi:Family of unknown function (DUF5329)
MKPTITLLAALLLVSASLVQFSYADVPPAEISEVEYLLGIVKNSPCKFERNGKLYDGEKAYEHIKDKYDYFRDEITSTETFIEYAATKSMLSGKDYLIRCGDKAPVKTADWLTEELKKYRESR